MLTLILHPAQTYRQFGGYLTLIMNNVTGEKRIGAAGGIYYIHTDFTRK